jgi:integrase
MPKLPRNYRINKGYGESRLMYRGRVYIKYLALDSPETRQAAQDWIHEMKKRIRLNKFEGEEPLMRLGFSRAADVFYELWYEKNPDRSHKARLNAQSVRDILKSYFKDQPLDTFTVEHIKEWRRVSQQKVKFNTVNVRHTFIKSLFERFNYWNKLGASAPIKPVKLPHPHYNPASLVEMPSEAAENRERICSLEELKRIKKACMHWHDEAMWIGVQKAINTMLRQKDLIRVEVGENIKLYQGKTKKAVIIPIAMTEKVNLSNFQKRWYRVRESAGCLDLQWRDLRRSGANLLRELGFSQEIIKDALGHRNQSTTDRYTNVKSERLKPALEAVGKILQNI